MADFKGFTDKTNELLIGIRFNNNKEWYRSHKEEYARYVHEPLSLLGDECYRFMNEKHEEFKERPKISRVNRDIRFSKNKAPYKESKWFFLREDGSPSICYEKPTFFFEISPDWYRYGMYYSPKPASMGNFRKKADADLSGLERIIDAFNGMDGFQLGGEEYKRRFRKDIDSKIEPWYQKKWLEFVYYGSYADKIFYEKELKDKVCGDFERLYPIYQYFCGVMS